MTHVVYMLAAGKIGDKEGAKSAYEAAKSIEPGNLAAYNSYIIAAAQLEDLEEAKNAYEAAQAVDNQESIAHYSIVQVLVDMGLYSEAMQIFNNSIAFPKYEVKKSAYDLHKYSHGVGVCTLLKLREVYPDQKSFTFIIGNGLHSNKPDFYEFQDYFRDFVAKEMPGWICERDRYDFGVIHVLCF